VNELNKLTGRDAHSLGMQISADSLTLTPTMTLTLDFWTNLKSISFDRVSRITIR